MIYLGEVNKKAVIEDILRNNNIKRIFIFGNKMELNPGLRVDYITYAQTIEYKFYYPWLNDIKHDSLVIWNDAMRTRNRYDLHYNCIRRYMHQAGHRLIFEYFPIKKEARDFMILWDMVQNNPFMKEPYDEFKFDRNLVFTGRIQFDVTITNVKLTNKEMTAYQRKKEALFGEIKKDPNIVPRRLLKFVEIMASKRAGKVFDTKKNFKPVMNIVVTQAPVDQVYMEYLNSFREELNNVCKKIQYK